MALQRFFNDVKKIIAAHQKFDGIVQYVQFFAQGVLECPGQSDHIVLFVFHRRIVAV